MSLFQPITLPHPESGEPTIFSLRYDLNALITIEELLKKSIHQLFTDASVTDENGKSSIDPKKIFSARNILTFLFAGLQASHPALDLETLGRMIDAHNFLGIATEVSAAFFGAFGTGEPEGEPAHVSDGEAVPGEPSPDPSVGTESTPSESGSASSPGSLADTQSES